MSATTILVSTVLVVLCLLAIALLTASLALLSWGERGQRDGFREAMRLLDRPWQIERFVYKHHRLFGLLVLAAGAFCLWRMTGEELAVILDSGSSASTLVWMLFLAQGFNLLVGLVILFRPSMLKPIETVSNRWHSLDSAGEAPPGAIRLKAVLLALVGLAVLLGSATLLYQQIRDVMG